MKIGQLNGLNLSKKFSWAQKMKCVVGNLLKLPSGRRTLLRRAFVVSKGAHEAVQLTNVSTPVVRMKSHVKTLMTTNDELLATNLNKS